MFKLFAMLFLFLYLLHSGRKKWKIFLQKCILHFLFVEKKEGAQVNFFLNNMFMYRHKPLYIIFFYSYSGYAKKMCTQECILFFLKDRNEIQNCNPLWRSRFIDAFTSDEKQYSAYPLKIYVYAGCIRNFLQKCITL